MVDPVLRACGRLSRTLATVCLLWLAAATSARETNRDVDKGIDCLTANIYHEARGESFRGQLATAQVVLNRVADPRWPDTICAVVWQPKQFSWTHDRLSDEMLDETARLMAQYIARNIIGDPMDLRATHYHNDTVSPYWAGHLTQVAQIGHHTFYQ